MSFNKETFALMAKFGIAMIGALMVIWLLACVTPYIAKLTDKLFGKAEAPSPERVEDSSGSDNGGAEENKAADAAEYKVYNIYEGSPSENNDKKD